MSALAGWNTDIKSAPHGRYVVKQRKEGVDQRVFVPERVILSTKCGKVTLSHYLPEEKRWLMLGEGEQPVAWMPWPEAYSNSGGMVSDRIAPSADHVSPPASQAASGGGSANEGGDYVNPQALPTVHTGNASLAAREGEKPLHSNSQSPSHAAVVTDDHLRKPMAAASGQIIREDGDAPQEASDGGNLSDTEFSHLPSGAAACAADTADGVSPPSPSAGQSTGAA